MSDGIQVNPSSVTDFAMQKFGQDYTQLVLQNAELRAFAESATQEVGKLENQVKLDQETIAAMERLLNESSEATREQATEIAELRARIANLDQPEAEPKDSLPE